MSDRVRLSPSARAAIQSDERLEVVLLLEENAWTATDLAKKVGKTRQAILHHLADLIEAGLVEEVASEPISGGALRSYGAVHVGWSDAIASLNAVVDPKNDCGPLGAALSVSVRAGDPAPKG